MMSTKERPMVALFLTLSFNFLSPRPSLQIHLVARLGELFVADTQVSFRHGEA